MEYILVLLIVALLNGAIAYIDGLMEGIIPLTLYAEQYMSTLAGVDLFQSLFDIVFGFGVSLIVLKFLKKGFETYVLWSDGDADEEPIAILTNFFKAMAVAICFPTMYDWLATIVEEMSNKMLEAIGLATAYDWAGWVSGISSMGLVTAIFGLVFVIVYFILYEWYAADITKVAPADLPRADLWAGGFPCQDISVAGRQRGLDGARSGLFFTLAQLVKGQSPENRPTWIVLENVKNLLSIHGGWDFATVLDTLASLGYHIEYGLLNTKDFGPPQNRERVYLVACRHPGAGGGPKVFPVPAGRGKALVQLIGGMQGQRVYDPSGISVTMAAQSGGWGGKTGLYFVDLCNGNPKLTSHARCIKTKYNSGITNRGGDNSGVFYGCRAVVTPEREEKKQNGRRIKECGEPAFTLTTQDRHGVFLQDCEKCPYGMHIREATKQGYAVARCGDSVNLAFPDSRTRRGRVGKDCTGTLETSCNQGTPFAGCGLIRRLTPRECWRLQGFTDEMFDRARAVNSDNQLYRQAGNSVTIQVVYAVGRQILAAQEALEQGESK